MQINQSIAIMKALAEPSRLAIINSLLESSQYVEELAKRHALAPSTISFHLRKLEKAGLVNSRKEQYYVVIQANDAIFDTTLREIVSATPIGKDLQDQRIQEYRDKVLATFFDRDRLKKLPAQHKKRLIVLQQFALRFEPRRRYSEQEVTGIILPLFNDYCTIRRLLVDEGLLCRDGESYWREQNDGIPTFLPAQLMAGDKGSTNMQNHTRRTEMKRICKQSSPEMGIYQIRNKANAKLYVASSRNLEGERNSRLFQLRMGKVVFNRELQKDLKKYGPDNFEFSVLAVLEQPMGGDDIEKALAALELIWLEKLQPFGEHGYNSAKGYERSKQRMQCQEGIVPS